MQRAITLIWFLFLAYLAALCLLTFVSGTGYMRLGLDAQATTQLTLQLGLKQRYQGVLAPGMAAWYQRQPDGGVLLLKDLYQPNGVVFALYTLAGAAITTLASHLVTNRRRAR